MTTVIVEPHSDDAWLSLGQHILDRALGAVAIVTVYGDETRMAEARAYAHDAGCRHAALSIPETGLGIDREWEAPPLDEDAIADAVAAFQPSRVLAPLGIRHPEHKAVRDALVGTVNHNILSHYIELPYALIQKNKIELLAMLDMYEGVLVSARVRSAAANASFHHFRSQSQFWRYNRDKMVGAMELILADSGDIW